MRRIAIISCKSKKQDYTCSADEMYSPSFVYKTQREFCKKAYDDYYIISSKYGIIHPTQIIEPYDITLAMNTHSKSFKEVNIQSWDEKMLGLIDKQLNWMKSQGWEIDYHTSNIYYSLLPKETKAKVNYIKQPRGVGASKPLYDNAINMLDTHTLDKCLDSIINPPKTKNPEEPKWFYHPVFGEAFGKAHQIAKDYPESCIDEGNLHKVSVGKQPQARGWVRDKILLDKLYQTDSGQWRLKK